MTTTQIITLAVLFVAILIHVNYIRKAPPELQRFSSYYALGLFAYTWPVWQIVRLVVCLRLYGISRRAFHWSPIWRLSAFGVHST